MASNSPKNILKGYNLKPTKYLGQNFLIDKNALRKIIKTADIKPSDIILEIGPGLGVLTKELAKRAKKVIAIEKDQRMCKILKESLKDYKNVEIINADILKTESNTQHLTPNTYKVVANLPYYITSPVIRKFLETENKPELMVLMVQKEVAQRICSSPPKMNLLAVSVQFYVHPIRYEKLSNGAGPEIITYVSKKSFWPVPKVDSAILRIAPLINTDYKLINADLFFKVVRAGFSQPRKQLANNLTKVLKLKKEVVTNWLALNKIKPEQRAETLTLNDWINLTKTIRFRI